MDIECYCAHAVSGMTAFQYTKRSATGFEFGGYIYCVDELTFYKLLNEWNVKYIGQYVFYSEVSQ